MLPIELLIFVTNLCLSKDNSFEEMNKSTECSQSMIRCLEDSGKPITEFDKSKCYFLYKVNL